MLRDRKANLWLRNAKGDLPLHEAAASGRRELVLWLLDQRPKHVNTTSNDGRTILHIAAGNDYTDMCKVCERSFLFHRAKFAVHATMHPMRRATYQNKTLVWLAATVPAADAFNRLNSFSHKNSCHSHSQSVSQSVSGDCVREP